MTNKYTIPQNFIQVNNPDHPFTYDGPDFLLSNKIGLIGVFKVRPVENKNPNKLISRLTNSLIAYPPHAQMVLLLDQNNQNSIFSRFEKFYFSKLIEIKDIQKAKNILSDKKSNSVIKSIKDVQKRIFNNQAQIQNDNIKFVRENIFYKNDFIRIKELSVKASYFDTIVNKEVRVRSNIYQYNDLIIGTKKLARSSSDIEELRPYYEFSINSDFSVDNGMPYFQHLTRKTLNLNEIPRIRYDPIKPIRVASLLGWYITSTNKISELEKRIPN